MLIVDENRDGITWMAAVSALTAALRSINDDRTARDVLFS